ncbi:MAG: hypothetical protein H6696_09300 [Deferribacteres bacterium]|nr:hypothetical protein [candidate division KSB1 bacterium]MCB9502122.1 hypothetical protein [Deferribacteres bacterium]
MSPKTMQFDEATMNNHEGDNRELGTATLNGVPGEGIGQIRNILLGDIISIWEAKISHMERGVQELINHTEAKLIELEERFNALDHELKEELETNLLEVEQENDDLRSMVQSLKEQFENQMHQLESGKLDKNSIADVFIQWGQKMQQLGDG